MTLSRCLSEHQETFSETRRLETILNRALSGRDRVEKLGAREAPRVVLVGEREDPVEVLQEDPPLRLGLSVVQREHFQWSTSFLKQMSQNLFWKCSAEIQQIFQNFGIVRVLY